MTDAIQTLVDRIRDSLKISHGKPQQYPQRRHSSLLMGHSSVPHKSDKKPLLHRSDSAIGALSINRTDNENGCNSASSSICKKQKKATAMVAQSPGRVASSIHRKSSSAIIISVDKHQKQLQTPTVSAQSTDTSKVLLSGKNDNDNVVDTAATLTPLSIRDQCTTVVGNESLSSSQTTIISTPSTVTNTDLIAESWASSMTKSQSVYSLQQHTTVHNDGKEFVCDIEYDTQMDGYANDIYDHLKLLEQQTASSSDYMETIQTSIEPWMRNELVDYLIGVAEDLNLSKESVHNATNYLDRYLSKCIVSRDGLECVFLAALLSATKYEEISPPSLRDIVELMDGYFNAQEIIAAEKKMLNTLQYRLNVVSSHSFLDRYLRASGADAHAALLAEYLCDLALADYTMLRFLPSEVAASAVVLTLHTLGEVTPWSLSLEHYTGIRFQQLTPCIDQLHAVFFHAPFNNTIQHIRRKFFTAKHGYIAKTMALKTPPTPAVSQANSVAPSP